MSTVIRRGEGERRYTARGSLLLFKAVADEDDGDLSIMERTLPPGGCRPPHRHTNCSEAYFVLDGLVAVTVSGEDLSVGPEEFVLVPRGTAHTFGNAGEREAGSWSSTLPRWMHTSPGCITSGTGARRPPRMR